MDTIKYSQSNIDTRIIKAVTEMGFDDMTPIQSQAIPVMIEGRDVIGQAQTGTGKTAAFGIPVLQSVNPKERFVQAVILCPTRELAIQAANEMRRFSKYMQQIKIVPVYGGADISGQIKLIRSGAQIVVGTPGRVMDHMRRHTLKMENVRVVVLDEADEMLNMGFREDMETILREMPEEHQTALFSATMPKPILDITHMYQKPDAVQIRVAAKELTIPLVTQYYYTIKGKYKAEAVKRLLQANNITRSIVFCNTKKMVDDLVSELKHYGYNSEGLHGDLSQKQRDMVMKHFRGGHTQVLVATDVAARGIDVDDLEAVINYDIPQDIEYYVHRIGRTGRAGREGVAFTLVTRQDFYRIKDIEKICRTKMIKGKIPQSREITALQAEKYLEKAEECIKFDKLDHLKRIIELRFNKEGESQESSDMCRKAEENQENINTHDKAEGIEAAFSRSDIIELAAALLKLHIGEETTDINIEDKIYEYRGDERRSSHGRNGYGKDDYGRTGYGRGGYGRDDGKGSYKKGGYSNYGSGRNRSRTDVKDAEKRNREKVTADKNGKAYKSTKKLGRR
ncbi:MAG: DEAD/DEAH box helicase [Lachnospiraceae bacterium]